MFANNAVDIAIIVAYCCGVILAGLILSKRAAQNVDSYFLGGREIPWYLLGISNASGMFDITGTMLMVTLLFVYGPKSVWIPWVWPTFNQIFLMIFLARWLRRSGVLTGAEWLRTRFGDGRGLSLAHISVVIFALVTVVAFIAYAFIGVGKFAAAMLPWEDVEPNTYAMVFMGITAIYVVFGGMYSVVLTDVIQFVLLTFASIMVAVIAMSRTTAEQIADATPEHWQSFWFDWQLDLDWSNLLPNVSGTIVTGGYEFFTAFVMMALLKGILASIAGPTPGYDMQRVLATKDERSASLMSGVVSPVLFVPRYLLIAGIAVLAIVFYSEQLAGQERPDFEQILPYVIQTFIPVGLKGILLAGLLAAFMSTFDSTVNAGSAYVVNDIYKRYLNPQASDRKLIKISYASSIALVIIGVAVGHSPTDINTQMQWIAGGLYGGYTAPNVLKWIWWRLNGIGYFAGMIAGVVLSLLLANYSETLVEWLAEHQPNLHEIVHGAPSLYFFPLLLLGSGTASVVVSLITEPDEEETLKRFYCQVNPWGFWGPIARLVEREDPTFGRNRDFSRDMFNCAVGIAWQLALCAAPLYLVLKNFKAAGVATIAAVLTTLILKKNWYDHLPSNDTGGNDA